MFHRSDQSVSVSLRQIFQCLFLRDFPPMLQYNRLCGHIKIEATMGFGPLTGKPASRDPPAAGAIGRGPPIMLTYHLPAILPRLKLIDIGAC